MTSALQLPFKKYAAPQFSALGQPGAAHETRHSTLMFLILSKNGAESNYFFSFSPLFSHTKICRTLHCFLPFFTVFSFLSPVFAAADTGSKDAAAGQSNPLPRRCLNL